MQKSSSSPISATYRQGNFVAVVQLLTSIQHCFGTPLTAAHQASLSFTISLFVKTGVCSNSCPLSRWCHPTISSSVVPFSSCPQSLPASGSFPMSQHFARGGQSIGVSASALDLGLVSFRMDCLDLLAVQGTLKSLLQHHSSKASILQRSAFFTVQLSHHTWPQEKP